MIGIDNRTTLLQHVHDDLASPPDHHEQSTKEHRSSIECSTSVKNENGSNIELKVHGSPMRWYLSRLMPWISECHYLSAINEDSTLKKKESRRDAPVAH